MSNYPALDKVAEDIKRCYRCGYCRDMVRDLTGTYHPCPVREKLRHEHYCARGRNTIARGVLEGRLDISYPLRDVAYTCLSCDGCRDACSLIDWAKVDSPKINQAMREELHRCGMTPEKIRNVQQVKRTCGGLDDKATCRVACPLGQDVPGYVELIAEGRPAEAMEVIRRTNPLPSICGKACTHPCESACRQSEIGEPIAIQYLKRFCVDREKKLQRRPAQPAAIEGPRVAVIGSGPAGLSAANYLARSGFRVSVFEKDIMPGGMMTYAIPEFTLPHEDVLYDIERLRELGVEIQTGSAIHGQAGISGLLHDGFKAVLLCVGTWSSVRMGLPGEDLDGVWDALEFLRRVKCGEPVPIGSKVVVVGGGKAALDSARTALRLGARDVVIVYRRHRERAPFDSASLMRAIEEGVQFTDSVLPVEFVGTEGKVRFVRLRDAGTGVPAKNLRDEIDAQTVVIAIGQKADLAGLGMDDDIKVTPDGTFAVDQAFRISTSLPIFAAGDVVTGPSSIVEAMASGRDAARAVAAFLKGSTVAAVEAELQAKFSVAPLNLDTQKIRSSRTPMPRIAMARRRTSFQEVDRGFTNALARQEASRCLNCDKARLSDLPVVEDADTLFFIGCNDYFRYPEVARAAVEVLAHGGMRITATNAEQCCGSPAYWSGDTALAQELQQANKAMFQQMGITKIITACADCYEMLARHYQLSSLGITVEHFAQAVADLLQAGKLRLNSYKGVVTYHDPCQLARKEGVIDEPRTIFSAIQGLQLVEMERTKKGTQCCGGGPNSLVQLVNPELAGGIAHDRIADARGTGASALVTACSWCRTQFESLSEKNLPIYDLPYFIRNVVGLKGEEQDDGIASPDSADELTKVGL